MNAKEIMSTPVVVTRSSEKLSHLKDLFTRHNINSAPVLKEDGEIEGIITSSDLKSYHREDFTVGNIMTRKVKVCATTARVNDIAQTMVKEDVNHLVVMDNGQVVGIISSLDVIKKLLEA